MASPEIVFRGVHSLTFNLPSVAEVEEDGDLVDVPGFEAVYTFCRLEELRVVCEAVFSYAQAVCVDEIEDWDCWGTNDPSVLVLPEAVRWILCFPVQWRGWEPRGRDGKYVPRTKATPPDGEDVFYTFASLASAAPASASVQAVPDLDSLKFLTPQPGDKLVVIRAKDWSWDDRRQTACIQPWDILEIEFIVDSDVRVF
jgi:hypothetical protein